MTVKLQHWALVAGLAAATALPLPGQQGDREGDPQPPLPEHIVAPPAPPLPVDEALATFRVAPGFRLEVAAAEPLVSDPVAVTIGPDGRMWVVEMRGYMPDVDATGEEAPVGVIAVLTDTDGDGRMDERREFATGLVLPRALALVDGGVLVAEPPHLWWYHDRDGDGVADGRAEVASDYGAPGNPEHTANGLFWALDNWIYNANHRTRFRYLGDGRWSRQPTVGRGQWGITQDNTGRLYYNNNSLPLQVDLIPADYLLRNPELAGAGTAGRTIGALRDVPVWPIRVTPGVNRGYKILNEQGMIEEVTAACAPLIYRGSLFPADFAGDAFICEPAGHLVKRLKVAPTPGGDLDAFNAYAGAEFLASTDERFRPVNLATGPDGALYVVDMYRGVIQHRTFVTTFLRQQIEARDLEKPIGLGRIYRVVPEEAQSRRGPVKLDQASADELVATLDHADGWWRDTAQRLLVERQDPAPAPALRRLLETGSALGRLHALWTLDGLGAVEREDVRRRLGDEDAAVRAAAARVGEPWLRRGDADLLERVIALMQEASHDVRRQAALSLGQIPGEKPLDLLVGLAARHGTDVGMGDAIVSGLRGRELAFLRRIDEVAEVGAAAPVAIQAVETVLQRAAAAEVEEVLAWLAPERSGGRLATFALAALERRAALRHDAADTEGRPVRLPVEPAAVVERVERVRGASPLGEFDARLVRLLPLLQGPEAQAAATADPLRPLTAEEEQRFRLGEAAFAVCAGCHHPEGYGYTGVAPSLRESRWATGSEEALIRIVLHGKEGDSFGMPPLAALDDPTIAAITTYIRRSWGHRADPVTPEQVADVRAAEAGRDRPWTVPELEGVAEETSSP